MKPKAKKRKPKKPPKKKPVAYVWTPIQTQRRK